MPEKIRVFISPEMETKFIEAYEAVLKQWPVLYDELYIPTRFGDTHVVASGPEGTIPVVLLNPGGGSVAVWRRNVESLSQNYRTFAVDVIGEMNRSIPTRPITSDQEFIEWITDLFSGLKIGSTHVIGNSNGGFLALNIALRLPERVKKVVLMVKYTLGCLRISNSLYSYLRGMLNRLLNRRALIRWNSYWIYLKLWQSTSWTILKTQYFGFLQFSVPVEVFLH